MQTMLLCNQRNQMISHSDLSISLINPTTLHLKVWVGMLLNSLLRTLMDLLSNWKTHHLKSLVHQQIFLLQKISEPCKSWVRPMKFFTLPSLKIKSQNLIAQSRVVLWIRPSLLSWQESLWMKCRVIFRLILSYPKRQL